MLFVIALAPLTGCWHQAFHTSVENDTKQAVSVSIRFSDGSSPTGHGTIETGNSVNLTQQLEDISEIEYRVGDHLCAMNKDQMMKSARADGRGLKTINLNNCAPVEVVIG